MLEVIYETLIDSIKLLPFLFITYLIMEYIEHKLSEKSKETIKKSKKFGPLVGSILGIFPQCGFSVSATNLYAARIISLGTLISIYLATSDEMLPILISEAIDIKIILIILLIKVIIGMVAGFAIDLFLRKKNKKEEENNIVDMCEHEHCHCEESLIKSSLKHTINIFIFIMLISLVINVIIYFVGEDALSNLVISHPILSPIITCLIGLIPNCASSVIITKLYIANVLSAATMIGGLLVNSGLGLIVLCKVNKNVKENIAIIATVYVIGVLSAILLGICGFTL